MPEDDDRAKRRRRRGRPPKMGTSNLDNSRTAPMSPPLGQIPDWSEETIASFAELNTMERTFVEWIAAGRSGTDAYRLATGRQDYPSARFVASRVRSRPAVNAAILLALKDRNFGARYDREYKLQKLGSVIDRLELSENPEDWAEIPRLIKLMADLQGDLVKKHEITTDGLAKRSDVHLLISEIVALAKGYDECPENTNRGKIVGTAPEIAGAAVGAIEYPPVSNVVERGG